MKIFDKLWNELNEADLDLERGRLIPTNRIKPDAKPIDNVTKFAYEDDDYEDVLQYDFPDEADWLARQIDHYKKELADTDFHILKVVEGAKTLVECAEIILKRRGWRSKINELEAQLAKLKGGAS